MQFGQLGLDIRAVDVNGFDVRGGDIRYAVKYLLYQTDSGKVIQEWPVPNPEFRELSADQQAQIDQLPREQQEQFYQQREDAINRGKETADQQNSAQQGNRQVPQTENFDPNRR